MDPVSSIAARHRIMLGRQAIDPDYARKMGIVSASIAEDLPEELAHLESQLPGLLYPLRRLDGTIVPQLRLDDPPVDDFGKPQGKYRQPPESGSIITVPASMAERVGKADTLIIVEGTKQTVAATILADANPTQLVVGVQGCWGWRDGDTKEINEDLVRVASGRGANDRAAKGAHPVKRVVIIFDADMATNPAVWAAANGLRTALKTRASIPARQIKFVSLAFLGGTQGLDDYLGSKEPEERGKILASLVKGAGALGKKPAPAKSSFTSITDSEISYELSFDPPYIDEIRTLNIPDAEPIKKRKRLLNASAQIRRAEKRIDETGDATLELFLDVYVDTPHGVFITHDVRVSSHELSKIGIWLDKANGSGHVARPTLPSAEIDAAIRHASPDMEHITSIPKFGWHLLEDPLTEQAQWVWVGANGGMGLDTLYPQVIGRPAASDWTKVKLLPVQRDDYWEAQLRQSMRTFLDMRHLLVRPIQWILGVSAVGLAFLPVVPNATLGFFGPRSSGKSTIAQALSTIYTPDWGPNHPPMASFNSTAAGIDLMAAGLNNSLLHFDDLKPEKSRKLQEEVMQGLDSLLRRSFGAGGRRRGGVERSSGRVVLRDLDSSTPLLMITGEEIPTGNGGLVDSGLDRLVIVGMEANHTFMPQVDPETGNLDNGSRSLREFYNGVDEGRFTNVLAAYLPNIARSITHAEDLPEVAQFKTVPVIPEDQFEAAEARMTIYRQVLEQIRDEWTADIETNYGEILDSHKVSTRARRAIGSLLMGLESLLQTAAGLGVIDKDEYYEILGEASSGLVNLVAEGSRTFMDDNMTPGEKAISTIKALLSSRKATLSPDESGGSVPLVGEVKDVVRGQRAVALNHEVLAKLLNYSTGARGLVRDLKDYAIESSEGKSTNKVLVGGQTIRCLCIPLSIWNPEPMDPRTAPDF